MRRIVWSPDADATYLIRDDMSLRSTRGEIGRICSALRTGDAAGARRQFPRLVEMIERAGLGDETVRLDIVQRSPHLRRLQIEVALACNLHCNYCYSTSGPNRRERLSSAQVLKLLDDATAMGCLSVDFTGGEFLMDPDALRYLDRAHDLGLATTIHTNGTIVNEAVIDVLCRTRPRAVQISVDSHLSLVHDQIRGSRNALRRTFATIERLTRANLPVRLSMMVHRANLNQAADSIRFFRTTFPKVHINIDRIIAVGSAVATDTVTNEEFWSVVSEFRDPALSVGKICDDVSSPSPFEPECGVAYSFVYATAEGELASCPTMTGREDPRFRGPNLADISLAEAWYDSDHFVAFRDTNCENVRTCPAGSACGGGCRSNAYADTGNITGPDIIACNTRKNPGKVFVDFPKLYKRSAT